MIKPQDSIQSTKALGNWVFFDKKSEAWNRGHGKEYYETRGYTLVESEGELFNLKDELKQYKYRFSEKPELVKELKAILEQQKNRKIRYECKKYEVLRNRCIDFCFRRGSIEKQETK